MLVLRSINVRKKNKTSQGMEWRWKGRGAILDGANRESLSEEITLAVFFKRNKNKHTLLCYFWGASLPESIS